MEIIKNMFTDTVQRQYLVGSPCHPLRRPRSRACCVQVKDPPRRPDPAIYSQEGQLAAGQEPNWNSPDITTNHWSPWRLYEEPEVKVRNLSPSVSAVNVLVHFAVSPFGIGTQQTPLGAQITTLAAGQEVVLKYPLPQAVLGGEPRIGTHVVIEHSADANLANNRGGQTIDGLFTSEAGRDLQLNFPVRNPLASPQQITLSVVANDLGAAVAPAVSGFAAFQQIDATLSLSVPNNLHGAPGADLRREITVMGWDQGNHLIGGLTFILRIDD